MLLLNVQCARGTTVRSQPVLVSDGHTLSHTYTRTHARMRACTQVFEVLASVPWLDEDDVQQKALKGVAMVGGWWGVWGSRAMEWQWKWQRVRQWWGQWPAQLMPVLVACTVGGCVAPAALRGPLLAYAC